MKKLTKWFSVIALIMMFFSVGSLTSFAEDKKEDKLLYDLKYNKDKSVLYGKSKPGANIYINDIAGSIVASEDGSFEMPIPKGAKISQVLMLDAEGNNSTDLRYNFEKNTVVAEEKEKNTSDEEQEDSQTANSSKKKDNGVDIKAPSDDKEVTDETTGESEEKTKQRTEKSIEHSSEKPSDISSENYNVKDAETPKKSKVWLWTLLIIVLVIGSAVGAYFWYKRKIEKEEAQEKKNKSGNKKKRKVTNKDLDDVFEDDLYETFKETEKKKKPQTKEQASEMSLEDIIDSELSQSKINNHSKNKSSKKKKSRSSQSSKHKRKKVKK